MPQFKASEFSLSDDRVRLLVRTSNMTYVQQVRHLHGVYSLLPDEHLWCYDSQESMAMPEPDEDPDGRFIVEVYKACLRDLQATVLGLAWKARECTAVSVQALNQRRLAGSAAAARSAFEAATAGIDHCVRLSKAQAEYKKSGNVQILIERLDQSSMRGLWGRKGSTAGDINANHFLKHQDSVLKIAGAKDPEVQASHLLVYEVLCNMAHPSADGHQHFWRLPDGPAPISATPTWVQMSASPDLRPSRFNLQLTSVLWALGWSCAHAVRSHDLVSAEVSNAEAVTEL